MKHTKNFAIALFLSLILTNQAFAYEKSGFFVGFQGGASQYNLIDKTNNAHSLVVTDISAKGNLAATECTSTSSSSGVGDLGGLIGLNKTTVTTKCTPSQSNVVVDGNSSVDLFMDTFTTILNSGTFADTNVGFVVGYKHFFADEMDYGQFQNFTLPLYRFGYRVYLVYDIGKVFENYKNQSINLNFDALYNFFPEQQHWDLGAFVGFSLGYTHYDMDTYKIKGADYALNAGLRGTFFERHNIEIFGRFGLNKLKYSYKTDASITRKVDNGTDTQEVCATMKPSGGSAGSGLGFIMGNGSTSQEWLEAMGYTCEKEPVKIPATYKDGACIRCSHGSGKDKCNAPNCTVKEHCYEYEQVVDVPEHIENIGAPICKKCASVPLNTSHSSVTIETPGIINIEQEIKKKFQFGIRYTYTF